MKRALLLIAVIGMLLSACAEPSEEAAADPTEFAWSLESGTLNDEEIPIVEDHPITLVFDEESVGGASGCNTYFGGYTIEGTSISFTDMGSTMMACEPAEVMDSEVMYLAAMAEVTEFSATVESLTLTGEGVQLNFVVDDAA